MHTVAETAADTKQTQKEKVSYWLTEIDAARRREKDWRREGRRILEIYGGKKKDSIPFNILYSNTETLLPALYNAQPRAVVQRRFKDEDPMGKAAATAGQRGLEFLIDTNSEEYSPYDDVMGDAVIDALLPGRAATRIKYDAKITGPEGARKVEWELVCFESVKWDRWIFGYAKKWKRVPWVAFEHDIREDEAKELFGEKAKLLTYTEQTKPSEDSDDKHDRPDEPSTNETIHVAKVWEVWHKTKKRVFYVSPNAEDDFLFDEKAPLDVSGFYPMPEPLRFLRKSNDLQATPPYNLYENQAKELNRLSVRINKVAEAIKVRGAYDSTLTELDDLLRQDDNAMVGAQNVAALQDGGLEKAIWLMPVEKLIIVLQQLYLARNNCKQVIYEITGISDILRGSTVASETATAQQLKAQWGTLRLKRMQREVQRYARDILRLTLEIAADRFGEKTWAGMTGLPFATEQEVLQAQGQIAAARAQIAMKSLQSNQPLQPGQMEQMLPQAVPQALQTLQKPQWAQVLALLRSDTQRMYRVDIETNSTVDLEATEDQKIMGEVLQAISQFMQGVAPLVQSGSMPFEVAQSMLLAVVRRYRFGSEIEDYIKQMKQPPSPDQAKQQAEAKKMAFEQQKAEREYELDQKEREAELAMKRELAQIEHAVKKEELEFKREELRLKKDLLIAQTQAKIAQAAAQAAASKAAAANPAAGKEPARAPA